MDESKNEIFAPNSWYGFARVVKKYAKWPFPLPIVIPHGIELSKNFLWRNEIDNDLPGIWLFPKHREHVYKKYAKNKIFLNGCSPWLFLCKKQSVLKKRNGLIAFPAHSTHHVTAVVRDRIYAKYLKKNENKYGLISICMYWRDIEIGRDKIYKEFNFPVVCAGHMFDEKFAEKLYEILSSFEFMHTNEIGSHLYYAASAGCKVILENKNKIKYIGSKKIIKRDIAKKSPSLEKQIIKVFKSKNFIEQQKISLELLGNKYKPSPFQMFLILLKLSIQNKNFCKKVLSRYLQRTNFKMDKVNLGCGKTFHPSWENFDFSPSCRQVNKINLLQPLRFKGSNYKACYLSHVLEHLPRHRVPSLLLEIYCLLSERGILRIVVPDLEIICRCYLEDLKCALTGDSSAIDRHEWMTMELLDQMTRTVSGGYMGRLWWSRPLPAREFIINRLGEEAGRWLDEIDTQIQKGAKPLTKQDIYQTPKPKEKEIVRFREQGEIHQWMYDRVSLKRLLEEAGFQSVKVCGPTESGIPDFVSYHLDTNEKGETRKPDSLFMEAVKSG